MTEYSIDIAFAYAQLGLAQGASFEEIQAVFSNAAAYRFYSKTRLAHVRRFVDFFAARQKLGPLDASFSDVRKAYYNRAKALHPDSNKGSKQTEEQLKTVNAAYESIEAVHREAKLYYKQNESVRADIEREAREATEQEKPAQERLPRYAATKADDAARTAKPTAARAAGAKKYLAASVPRSVRSARLSYLPVRAIIGSKVTKKPNDLNLVFDFIMLPEGQFLRAKSYLAAPEAMGAALTYGKFSPPYILKGVKEILVAAEESDPESFAKEYFRKEFGL